MKKLKDKFLKPVLLVSALLLIGGCTVRMSYPFLDWVMYWSLDDYFDFDRDQRKMVKTAIGEFHHWHRYQELPQVAADFEALASELAFPAAEQAVTAERVSFYGDKLLEGWRRLMLQLVDPTVELLASLSDEQAEELFAKLVDDEEDTADDYARESLEERIEIRAEYMQNAAKKIVGKLTEEQLALIQAWAPKLAESTELSIDHSQRWRERLKATLQDREDKALMKETITQLFAYPDQYWSDDYRAAIEQNRSTTDQLIADLLNSMTDKQRAKITRKLGKLASDFRALSKEKD